MTASYEISTTAPSKPEGRSYVVGITYCDDIASAHDHDVLFEAMQEYAAMLGEAVEPTSTHPEARHIRMVTLIVKDELGDPVQHIDTGVIPCADRPE